MDCPKNLIYVSDEVPGFIRKKRGRGFAYFDIDNNKINSAPILRRIKALVIPPAWKNVWICPLANGHLQSTGIDLKNRKQYIYHPDWVVYRKQNKYEKLAAFGKSLPKIREKIERDMRRQGWPREKVMALIVNLMDKYYFRVGRRKYAKENNSYGVTTLRRKHIHPTTESLVIKYVGKSGKPRKVKIHDRSIIKRIKELSELPGYEIFKYQNAQNQLQSIDAADINGYLKEITGDEITAKDFRTWGGTKLSLIYYDQVCSEMQKHTKRKFETSLVRKVSESLGNTLSVCREYYIHPKILQMLQKQYNDGQMRLPIDLDSPGDKVEEYLLEILSSP